MIEACFTALTTLLIIIIFRSEPLSPPSASEKQHLSINIKETLIGLFTNRHYLILLFSFSIGLALFSAITTLLYQLIEPTGYSSDDAGIFGAVIIIAGLLNALVVGVIMDRTHAYRLILKILLVGACASGIYFILILQPNKFYPLAVSIGLMGFFLLPLLPVSFECAVECTYPIRAEWSTGLLMCSGNVLGGVFIFVLGYLIKLAPVSNSGVIITPASIFILCCLVIAASVLMIYKGPYLRLAAESRAVTTSSIDIDLTSF
jgi:MFS family permease